MKPQPKSFATRLALAAISALSISLAPTAVHAEPPATVATCPGIKAGYPILGTRCENNYAKIKRPPVNAEERLETYQARVAVMTIFRKALLCNAIYGAQQSIQNAFKGGEAGHLTAIKLLHDSMVANADPTIPDLFTADDLKSIKMTKQQCR